MTESTELTTGRPIWDLGLSAGTVASLERCDIASIGDLLKRANDGTLTKLPRIGDRRKEEILNALQQAGFAISVGAQPTEARFETLLRVAETYCHPEAWEGAYGQLQSLARDRPDDPEMVRLKADLRALLSDPAQVPRAELSKAAEYDDGSAEKFLARLWHDLYPNEPPPAGPETKTDAETTGNTGSSCPGGLAEVGDDGWAYELGDVVYTLTAEERGWRVSSSATGTGPAAEPQRFGDLQLAERAFFRTVAIAIVAHRPYVCEVPIGGARLVIVHVGGCWHVAEASDDAWACAYAKEEDARRSWLTRGVELLKEIAGECGYYG